MNESALGSRIRLAMTKMGGRLFRNNVGLARYKTSRGESVVQYGLGVGSPDYVGFYPVVITEAMVGKRLAVFVGAEVKSARRKTTPEQAAWIDAINRMGGVGVIVKSVSEFERAIEARTGGANGAE